MVVEDDLDAMKIASALLATAGYQVVQAYGGKDALRKIHLHQVDLVLTDLAMPDMSGVEVIAAIKSDPRTAHIPVIAVTAFVWDQFAQSAAQVGCDGFIAKPVGKAVLLREVEKHLRSGPAGAERK